MKCTVCGYEDDTQFLICPYCGEEVKNQNQYQQNNDVVNNPVNDNSNYKGNCNEIQNNQLVQPFPQYNPNPLPNVDILPTSKPRDFIETENGFRITCSVEDGDFYYNYMLFNILGGLTIIIFLISSIVSLNNWIHGSADSGPADSSITFFTLSLLIIPPIAFLLNCVYSVLMNNFVFEVSPEGVSIKSPMKQYFISKSNIKASWFQSINKKANKVVSFFKSNVNIKDDFIFSGRTRRSRYSSLFRQYDNPLFHDTARMIHNRDNSDNKGPKKYNNVFIEVTEPIFANNIFASDCKRNLRIINTGISFQSAVEARFVVQELRSVLGLPDILIPTDYDYNFKRGVANNEM